MITRRLEEGRVNEEIPLQVEQVEHVLKVLKDLKVIHILNFL